MALVFLFPGENSRHPGMIGKFAALHPANGVLLEQASDIVHRDLRDHYSMANPQIFRRNRDVQIGVFLANHMLLCSLRRAGIDAAWSLGLGVGEYNHLVHIGALTMEGALNLLEERGNACDMAPQGVMASVSPIELRTLEGAVGACAVALHCSPREQAISGGREAVEAVLEALGSNHVQHCYIDERLPAHSPIMGDAAARFRLALERATWGMPRLPYVPNAVARLLQQPSREEFIDALARQLHQPVLWRESLDLVAEAAAEPFLVEVGPKSFLHGLAAGGWLNCPVRVTDSAQGFGSHFARLVQELQR
jgi:[acyl-carrier-protein] S-malonyltransferase